MSWIIGIVLKNWLPLLMGLAAAFFGGKVYLKGRKHAKAKSDKELNRALQGFRDDAKTARDAGLRAVDSELRTDDGFRRDERD